MIIKSSKHNNRSIAVKKIENKLIVNEEIKPVVEEEVKKPSRASKKKKTTPVIEELPVVEEKIEESEIEDLKPWFEEDIDD